MYVMLLWLMSSVTVQTTDDGNLLNKTDDKNTYFIMTIIFFF